MSPPRVALVSGFWGQNVGNAFFNVGGRWVLEQVFGAGNVEFVRDQPGYWTFNRKSQGNPRNSFDLLARLDVDYIVLQGPVLSAIYAPLWTATLDALTRRGTRVVLLGAAFFKYTDDEIAGARAMIERFPPLLISTRDSRTYQIVKEWVPHAHDGIDSAFFVPKAYSPFGVRRPHLTFNFDRYPEPTVNVRPRSAGGAADFDELDHLWSLTVPRIQSWFSHRGKAIAYAGHALDRRRLPRVLAGRTVVRPEHRMNPHMGWKIYRSPNAVVADEPWTYFTLYANTDLTLSDRVHACVMTLAYGKPAMLFTPSPRSALFERLGLADIKKRPVRLDPDYLEEQRQGVLDFLRRALETTT